MRYTEDQVKVIREKARARGGRRRFWREAFTFLVGIGLGVCGSVYWRDAVTWLHSQLP